MRVFVIDRQNIASLCLSWVTQLQGLIVSERNGGLVVSALVSGSSGVGWSPDLGHCVEF